MTRRTRTHAPRLVWPPTRTGEPSRSALCLYGGFRPHLADRRQEVTCRHCLRLLTRGERASFVGPLRMTIIPITAASHACQNQRRE